MAGGTFVTSALLARLLSPEDLGAYMVAFSVATTTAMISRAGMEKTALQVLAKHMANRSPAAAQRDTARIFLVASVSISFGAATWIAAGPWVLEHMLAAGRLLPLNALIAAWMALLALEVLIAEAFRGFGRIAEASVFGGAASRVALVSILCAAILADVPFGLSAALVAVSGALSIALVPAAYLLWRQVNRLGRQRRRAVSGEARTLLRTSFSLMLVNLTFLVMNEVGLWVLVARQGEAEVAVYGLAYRLVMLVGFSLSIVNAVLPPLISELHQTGQTRRLETTVRGVASLAGVPAVLALMAFLFFGGQILSVAFGDYYANGWGALAALSVGQLACVFVGSSGYLLMMTGHQDDMVWIAVVACALAASLSVLLVDRWAVFGVAVATSTAVTTQQVLLLIMARKRCGVWGHMSLRALQRGFRETMRLVLSKGGRVA